MNIDSGNESELIGNVEINCKNYNRTVNYLIEYTPKQRQRGMNK